MCLQNVFSGMFSPRGKASLLQEQILSFRVLIFFQKFLSWKANRKSQKLLYFMEMAEERGTVSSYLNVFGYTTVLYRLSCKEYSSIISAGKGWEVNFFRKKMFRENGMRKNPLIPISRKVVHKKKRRLGRGERRFSSILVISLGNLCRYTFQTGTVCFWLWPLYQECLISDC